MVERLEAALQTCDVDRLKILAVRAESISKRFKTFLIVARTCGHRLRAGLAETPSCEQQQLPPTTHAESARSPPRRESAIMINWPLNQQFPVDSDRSALTGAVCDFDGMISINEASGF